MLNQDGRPEPRLGDMGERRYESPDEWASSDDNVGYPKSTAQIAGHPLHPMLVTFPITFFLSAAATDMAYLATGERRWAHASRWLLGAGLASGAAAAAAGTADYLGDRQVRRSKVALAHMVGNVAVMLIESVNLGLRLFRPERAVAGGGLRLSLVSAGLLGATAWLGGSLVYKQRVGVSPPRLRLAM